MSSRGTPTPSKTRPSRGSPFRVGGENQGTHYYLIDGSLVATSHPRNDLRDHHVHATFRNVYTGNELVGSIVYDTSPVPRRDEIEVFSFFIKPKYRGDLRPFMALIRPLLRDGRPIDTMGGVVLDPKLEELIPRAVKSGRVKMGSKWTAQQQRSELLEESARALEASQSGEEARAVEFEFRQRRRAMEAEFRARRRGGK